MGALGGRESAGQSNLLGFVDLQVNGYRGVSFSSAELTLESCISACEEILAAGGCAAIVPTVITSPLSTYEYVLPILADAAESKVLAGRVLGLHLEGPFISPEQGAVGTHPVRCVRAPRPTDGSVAGHAADGGEGGEGGEEMDGSALLRRWQKLARGKIRLLTVAAEADGAAALCKEAVALGIRVSLGHMLGQAGPIRELAAAGATLLTHLGNGCPNEIHRHKNHLWPALADDRLSAMLITDGQHLPPDLILAVLRCKGVAGALVTSDVAPVAGLPDGDYDCFGATVHVEGRFVRSQDRTCLAGSGALMLDCMNHLAALRLESRPPAYRYGGTPAANAPLSLDELMALGFGNPLRALGLDPAVLSKQLAPLGARVLYDDSTGQFRLI